MYLLRGVCSLLLPCHFFSQDDFIASWDNLSHEIYYIFMRKSCLLFTCLYRMLTHCCQQEETVLPRVVPKFLLLEYLQVSRMMIFEGIKLCLDHIHHLLLQQLAISSKSKCFNSCMHHYLMLQDYKNNSNLMDG